MCVNDTVIKIIIITIIKAGLSSKQISGGRKGGKGKVLGKEADHAMCRHGYGITNPTIMYN